MRHPLIFYLGNTATFYINKLIVAKITSQRINPRFESIFAVGVDEMSWDDGRVLVITSPYTWSDELTKNEHWMGGFRKGGEPCMTLFGTCWTRISRCSMRRGTWSSSFGKRDRTSRTRSRR